MRTCPSCPTTDAAGHQSEPNRSRDQRHWAADGRCHRCHNQIQREKAHRKAARRNRLARRAKPQFNARTYNWSRV